MQAICEKAEKNVIVPGICNSSPILLETDILEGTLMLNASLKFICQEIRFQAAHDSTRERFSPVHREIAV